VGLDFIHQELIAWLWFAIAVISWYQVFLPVNTPSKRWCFKREGKL